MRIISALLIVGTSYSSNVKTNNCNRKRLVGSLLLAGLLAAGAEPIQPNGIREENSYQKEIISVAGEPAADKFDFLDVGLWRAENPILDSYIAPSLYERFIDSRTYSSSERAKRAYLEFIELPKGVYVDFKAELRSVQMLYQEQAKDHGIKMQAPVVPMSDIISNLSKAEVKHLIRERVEAMWKECESSGDLSHCEQFAILST